jgi:hypothetical protein
VNNLVCRSFEVTVTAAGSLCSVVHVFPFCGFRWSNFLSCSGVRQLLLWLYLVLFVIKRVRNMFLAIYWRDKQGAKLLVIKQFITFLSVHPKYSVLTTSLFSTPVVNRLRWLATLYVSVMFQAYCIFGKKIISILSELQYVRTECFVVLFNMSKKKKRIRPTCCFQIIILRL